MKFLVLGGYGIIGKAVVADLFKTAKNAEITIGGRDVEKAKRYASSFRSKRVCAVEVNVHDVGSLAKLCSTTDIVVNCIQYYFNLEVMKACLKAKVHYVDLGGMFHTTIKQLKLNKKFKNAGITAVLGIGATPGITNVLAGYGANLLKQVRSVEIVFADIDNTKYKQKFVLPYSFKTLIDEYTMKPAVFKNGKMIFVEPRTGEKVYNFGKVFGKQESFYTLHSELATLPFSLKHKGIKNCEFRVTFPSDFTETLVSLINLGFASNKILNYGGRNLKIIDISAEIMDRLLPKPGTKIKDSELLRVRFNHSALIMDALITSDPSTPAGVRDTAIPCSIVAQMIASGIIIKRGVLSPEQAVPAEPFFRELTKRNIYILKNGRRIN